MKNISTAKDALKMDIILKYPNADLTRFEFNSIVDQNGNVSSKKVFLKNKFDGSFETDITSDAFLNDPKMTKYPHINNNPFPKIWQLRHL